ncbi:hypothetical protein CCL45_gp01 [Sulfolobus islandicus rod-shaped virus 5]|uniref:Uncharacterized protein n=2 Tax=Usarudivirus SIRV5 TaxID=2846591 RepID=A0A1X9SKI6_9VIRU|nr:hypothetical protein CCL43_gp01 [Sulfolobus islandicus rod-shaped virus 7]YP_009362611.1 hypothetical protein CCL45_gp01 [Sulfolobus islandicus rod-shaped virus 5]YP_009362863.1 hypothetical protein CCL44_gp01 [Sulfolobus islandicus rod-shaped phage 6]ARQ96571.1 hypothetical protein [Sulfolobus islandicus rod-shaped virus 7]ARQ96623.1 hypothetical protein [Sulfolobus islandicus rod-shaped virus 5]ARQ96730.1 hypothetical protein [Sulfolobus islandicus rod-shaped phage 6]
MKQLTNEQISKLIEQSIKEGRDESKYYLVIKEYKGRDENIEIKQVYGKYELILVNFDDIDDNTREFEYVVIPKSDTVILLIEERFKYNSQSQKQKILYVFSYPVGWKSMQVM